MLVNFWDVFNVFGMFEEYNEKKLGIISVEEMIFGFEGVGVIVVVGVDVFNWEVGDEVLVIGLYDIFSSFVICL